MIPSSHPNGGLGGSAKFFAAVAALAAWIALAGHKVGPLPPLGKFLSPFQGFWRNAEFAAPDGASLSFSTLGQGKVRLEYDRRGVPHVFAPDYKALFFAQGFATARDRLWQMDAQSRAGLGRLAEVMGPKLFRFDLERRRMGLPRAAESDWDEIQKDSLSHLAITAYTEGVNAWIHSLSPADYPFEFKLLDYAPEPWTPLKSVALIKNMQWTLSTGSQDMPLTRAMEKLGRQAFAELYPLRHPNSDPFLPPEVFSGPSDASSLFPGVEADTLSREEEMEQKAPALKVDSSFPRPQPGAGSNNLLLSGKHTRSGRAILANDPHLDLTLPSIWYEIQLRGEDANAYGVSLPGLPGLVIGFNAHIAWGLTNGMDDVYDWYKLSFKDASLRQYFWNGVWMESRLVIDTLKVRGSKAVADTQVWTHLGPVPVKTGETPFDRNTPSLHALRWSALDASNTLAPFLRLLSAGDYAAFRASIAGLNCPSQNFAFADDSGGIALVHQGRLPVKRSGQGRLAVRGSDSSWEWSTFIADSLLPQARNPERGWLASANQEPTDSAYPYYLGSQFYQSERGGRLNSLAADLARDSAGIGEVWDAILDDHSLHAEKSLPLLLAEISSASLSPSARKAASIIRDWNAQSGYKADSVAPALFSLWWKHFHALTWSDDFDGDSVAYVWPNRSNTRRLLETAPRSAWFDDIRTKQREGAKDIAVAALEAAVNEAVKDAGSLEKATWGRLRPLSIPHLLRLPPLGANGLAGNGCPECVNAQKGSHGPSWRMVVEPGEKPRAWGVYPGGQTGNPGSPAFDAFVPSWLQGRPYALLYLENPGEQPDSIAYTLEMTGQP